MYVISSYRVVAINVQINAIMMNAWDVMNLLNRFAYVEKIEEWFHATKLTILNTLNYN